MAEWESLGTIKAVKRLGDNEYVDNQLIELFYKEVGKGVVFSVGEDKEIARTFSSPFKVCGMNRYNFSAHYYFNIPNNILDLFKKE